MRKFRKGDRVVYRCDVWSGNADLDGRAGTVIGVDGTTSPYTVEFDDELPDAMEDRRFGGKKGHCWCCTESHLIEENGGADDGPSDKSTNEKEKETMAREYVKWTEEEDAKLLSMKAEGKSRDEMAAELKKSPDQCKGRLYYLQKVKGKYGVTTEKEPNTAADQAEVTTQPKETPQVEQKGELNDLEKTMAETITELTSENDNLKGTVKDLEGGLCEAHEENTRLLGQIGSLTETVASLEAELADTRNALEQTEAQLDVEVKALQTVAIELEKAKAVETDFKSMVESYATEAREYKKRLTEVDIKYEELSREYSEHSEDLSRAIAYLNKENERLIRLIVRLTEERLTSHES